MIKKNKNRHNKLEAILFMKKIIISFLLIMFSYTLVGNILATTDALPKDALRMRVIANSNSSYDKKIKLKVKQGVEEELYDMLKNIKEVEKARTTVKNNTDIIDEKVRNILLKEHYPIGYKVKYGMNYFPKKEYKGVLYKEGYYESLVVTLGKGEDHLRESVIV